MLDSITLYVGSYLSEIGDTFGRLVARINSADKAIKDFDFAGVRFLIQFVNKNTVNKFMDVFVGQFGNGGVSAYQSEKQTVHQKVSLKRCPRRACGIRCSAR